MDSYLTHSLSKTCRLSLLLLQAAGLGLAAGPVYLREAGSSLALGNDYLERTISIADGGVGTVRFLNKITGRAYALGGSEFEMKLIYERVGYDFGGENPMVVTARGLRVADRKLEDLAGGGKRLVLHLDSSPAGGGRGRGGRGTRVDLVYELKPDDFFMRQWLTMAKPQQGTLFVDWVSVAKNEWGLPRFSMGGFGQPLFADDVFLGVEYPTAINQAKGSEVDLGGYIGLNIPPEGYTSEAAVFGVAPAGLVRQQFLAYVDRIRVAPVRPFALYNSWYDLQRLAMNHDNTLARVPVLNNMLFKKYGLHMDSFVLDDGWDDMQKLWAIDEKRFPGGFGDLVAALKGVDSRLGLWFGPIGGYNQRALRLATGKKEGMEITSDGQNLCIAGKNYSRFLRDTMLRYEKESGINYFKVDGTPFGCNEPDHGHPVGIYSREADARALIDILKTLRAQDPKVFLNITTSLWLSPWWLRYADTVWMGGADSGYLPSVPTLAQRQSAVSYRDSVLYSDFVAHRAQFPISSLMTHGIIKGKYNMLGGKSEFLDDWQDEVVHYYSVGNMMYELYISPDILSPEEMDALGNTTKWAEANAHPLLDNSTMVLGDPAQREPYGYVHSSAERSIVTLRNPFVAPRTVRLKMDEQQGFQKTDRAEVLEIQYPYRKMLGAVHFGDTLTFQLGGYEEILFELRPAAEDQIGIEGARYTAEKTASGATQIRLYAPEGSTQTIRVMGSGATRVAVDGAEVPAQSRPGNALTVHFGATAAQQELAYSPASLRVEGKAGDERTLHVTESIQVAADYREAKLAFLIEPEQDLRGVKGEGLDNGKPLGLALENGGRGVWHWFWANLTPGKHDLDLTFHLPASPGGGRISGWLLTKRALISKRIEVGFAPGRTVRLPEPSLLPASSNIERYTYALMEESIR
jgi:Melibiase